MSVTEILYSYVHTIIKKSIWPETVTIAGRFLDYGVYILVENLSDTHYETQ
jgi:hypothetical protein